VIPAGGGCYVRAVKRLPVAGLAALAALGLAACGSIDGDKLEEEIGQGLSAELQQIDVAIETVACPEDEESETGNKFDCTVTTEAGDELAVNVEVTDGDNGDVKYQFAPDALRELAFGKSK
jgi:hypothetical protein